ncbi:M20/M25/M40 family metallo-hydrolase [Stigmatella sp. ncwal1]|uniref:M20/M25/M40 family metallo-hydrolase n=1 Tax=Stigmatella ashevillensis TaxID=2995309 RepID=A0ABT5DBF8_9BACT|nr:M20/M25/M40 family metallo-hydrolase [Stigmatella ashevillena]MDC0710458.1 M20/M25/M40 family metallo-hydrolase [Stigmatella ashevillena]
MREMGEAAARWLEDRAGEMDEALGALVQVNSYTENPEGGRKLGGLLRECFAVPGLSAEVVLSARFADHLVFRSAGRAGTRPVALVGHLDTVYPPGRFEGYRKDGPLRRGPGVLDMKGGLVVMAWALRALAASGGLQALAPLRLVVVSDEEVGSPEGQGVVREAIGGAGACLVFEAGREGDAIITQRKGTGGVKVVAHGKAAHAGNAYAEGANAIWALARFVDGAQQLTDVPRGLTVNVGRVVGGQGKNTLPDRAEADVDLRFCTREEGEELVRRLQHLATQASQGIPGTRLELVGGVARDPLERTEASAALMAAYGRCAHASGLGHAESPRVGGGSDASTAFGLGIPSIDGLGPRGKGFHTVEEYIEVETLRSKAQALARFLTSWESSPSF